MSNIAVRITVVLVLLGPRFLSTLANNLPAPWIEGIWEGRSYYVNQQTGKTQWEKPAMSDNELHAGQSQMQSSATLPPTLSGPGRPSQNPILDPRSQGDSQYELDLNRTTAYNRRSSVPPANRRFVRKSRSFSPSSPTTHEAASASVPPVSTPSSYSNSMLETGAQEQPPLTESIHEHIAGKGRLSPDQRQKHDGFSELEALLDGSCDSGKVSRSGGALEATKSAVIDSSLSRRMWNLQRSLAQICLSCPFLFPDTILWMSSTVTATTHRILVDEDCVTAGGVEECIESTTMSGALLEMRLDDDNLKDKNDGKDVDTGRGNVSADDSSSLLRAVQSVDPRKRDEAKKQRRSKNDSDYVEEEDDDDDDDDDDTRRNTQSKKRKFNISDNRRGIAFTDRLLMDIVHILQSVRISIEDSCSRAFYTCSNHLHDILLSGPTVGLLRQAARSGVGFFGGAEESGSKYINMKMKARKNKLHSSNNKTKQREPRRKDYEKKPLPHCRVAGKRKKTSGDSDGEGSRNNKAKAKGRVKDVTPQQQVGIEVSWLNSAVSGDHDDEASQTELVPVVVEQALSLCCVLLKNESHCQGATNESCFLAPASISTSSRKDAADCTDSRQEALQAALEAQNDMVRLLTNRLRVLEEIEVSAVASGEVLIKEQRVREGAQGNKRATDEEKYISSLTTNSSERVMLADLARYNDKISFRGKHAASISYASLQDLHEMKKIVAICQKENVELLGLLSNASEQLYVLKSSM